MAQDAHQYWSMTEGVFNCLIDEERTEAFKRAIQNTVRKNDIVVDMGAGSGVLTMLALKAGAKKVYAIELDQHNIGPLHEIFRVNNVSDRVTVIHGDVSKIELAEEVDVIIGEMIATALIEELQIVATNNLLRFAKKGARILIKQYSTFLDLVNNNENYYGQVFKIVRYEYPDLKKLQSKPLSEKSLISDVNFSKMNTNLQVNREIKIVANKKGVINGIRLSGEVTFSDDSKLGATFAFNYPIILPMDSLTADIGDIFMVHVKYEMCAGFKTLAYSITQQKK